MTLDSADTAVAGRPDGVPEEPFDVEPPYVPSDEALAVVEKFEDRFLDRELSWLRLNQRVLELAEDETQPLLERVRFAAIFTSNLDEFFLVRLACLKRLRAAALAIRGPPGRLRREVREAHCDKARAYGERDARLSRHVRVPRVADAGIQLALGDELHRQDQEHCKKLLI